MYVLLFRIFKNIQKMYKKNYKRFTLKEYNALFLHFS